MAVLKLRFSFFKKTPVLPILRGFFWFTTGAVLGLFFFISFTFIFFKQKYNTTIYPGVMVNGIQFGGKSPEEVKAYFAKKNTAIEKTLITFVNHQDIATASAKQLNIGYDENLLSEQAYDIGRSGDLLSNASLVFQAFLYGINLPPSYRYSDQQVELLLDPIVKQIYKEPVNALFSFENGKVSAFQPSTDGREVDIALLKNDLSTKIPYVLIKKPTTIKVAIPIRIISPTITTDKVNNLGIKELVGSGTSLFQHSIPNRIYNITLAATRLHGILIAPDEVFSFAKAVGDISSFTGYKQAYIIQNGKTILGDGGGVCQVSTTLFRAALNTGLPIVERHPHAYRVGYYEQDSPPGLDASVYVPSLDLRFKNDTGHYLLIQTTLDPTVERITFYLYGTKDTREVQVSTPVVTNQIAAPAPLYQDDPSLPKGQVRQVEYAAAGATTVFTRQVKKNGKIVIDDKFTSVYRAWQAVYMRGTKEN